MKKNILFVIPSLAAGGGEKSLVNLLAHIDYSNYNVDLFLLNHEGIFMEYIPKEVNIVSLPETYKDFSLPIHKAMANFTLQGNYKLVFNRLMFSLRNRLIKTTALKEQYTWKYIASSLDELEKKYDVAIGFLEKTSTYFCVDKVRALKKIGWVHIDYEKLGMDPKFDMDYFNKLDHIVTVSEECSTILGRRFPNISSKIEMIYNIVSPTMINKMASQDVNSLTNKDGNEISILSIGRLHHQKVLI
ncbi:hypothetical protein [Anaerobacillus sp. CMMVII]|uniref:hypothetical protein n=1 Tax=Anaerobacillus sp. CMMVII TaxID=2755588 RepID=UPI0021B7B47B|nr:hypothetical protein [Anaerobacillus sp. CMMVII]